MMTFCGVITASVRAEVPEIVVSPYLVATPIARAGSTVSVISRSRIERSSAGSVADLLRTVPGLAVIERGGAGGQTQVSLRGAEAQHTLVLIDGIRVNDPSSARDTFDFAVLSLTDIERIEILKGPQSALYGSDAVGGVINIITRRPRRGIQSSATVEGGSYGTRAAKASMSGGDDHFRLLFSGSYFASAGFSRVGDRGFRGAGRDREIRRHDPGRGQRARRNQSRLRPRRSSSSLRHRQVRHRRCGWIHLAKGFW